MFRCHPEREPGRFVRRLPVRPSRPWAIEPAALGMALVRRAGRRGAGPDTHRRALAARPPSGVSGHRCKSLDSGVGLCELAGLRKSKLAGQSGSSSPHKANPMNINHAASERTDDELIAMLKTPEMWMVRNPLPLGIVHSLDEALREAYRQSLAGRKPTVIVKMPSDEITIRADQIYRLWQRLA